MKNLTIRARLATAFGATFLLAGISLLAVNYALIDRQFEVDPGERLPELLAELDLDPDDLASGLRPPLPDFDQVVTSDGRTIRDLFTQAEELIRVRTLRTLLAQGAIAMLAVSAIALPIGWWLSSRALRPVRNITATARALSNDDLSRRVNLTGPPDEITELAGTFDQMLDRLEQGFTLTRNFAALASHELRTPLAVMRVEADNALDDPQASLAQLAQRIRAQVDHSEAMIAQLMALTRSQAGVLDSKRVDLAELVGEVVAEKASAASSAQVHLDLDLADAIVHGDPVLLRVLVVNLVENAILHNSPITPGKSGGRAAVKVAGGDGKAMVEITNSGRMYTNEDVERMLRPFERVTSDRSRGSGLGLATARAIVEAHGGQLTAEPHPEGGLAVKFVL
jgi:signal transduction histidine kinase